MIEKHWGEKKLIVKKSAQPDGSKPEKYISVHENKIYYYAGVNRDSASELNKKIGELESKSLTLGNNLDINPPELKVFINSGGGVFCTFFFLGGFFSPQYFSFIIL